MRRVEFRTADDVRVAYVEIPPFQMGPDIVMWGSRVFWSGGGDDGVGDGPVETFYEACAVYSLTPSPGLPAL